MKWESEPTKEAMVNGAIAMGLVVLLLVGITIYLIGTLAPVIHKTDGTVRERTGSN